SGAPTAPNAMPNTAAAMPIPKIWTRTSSAFASPREPSSAWSSSSSTASGVTIPAARDTAGTVPAHMDVDRFVAEHQDSWARLAGLEARAYPVRKLSADELDDLVSLYQRVSTHLSYVRTYMPEPGLVARLTALVATANGIIYAQRGRGWRSV